MCWETELYVCILLGNDSSEVETLGDSKNNVSEMILGSRHLVLKGMIFFYFISFILIFKSQKLSSFFILSVSQASHIPLCPRPFAHAVTFVRNGLGSHYFG